MSEAEFRRVGLTGGIGAGKSTVTDRLRALGASVLDADLAARRVVEPGTKGLLQLRARYGEAILQPDGSLDRKALGSILFGSEEERQWVNGILHPLIKHQLLEEEAALLTKAPGGPVIWDVPLLIESNMHRDMDEVWLVVAEDEARIDRIMRRDGCSYEQAQARLSSQLPQKEKIPYADVIIENTGQLSDLQKQVDARYQALIAGGNKE